jgi:hypothetical protein
MFVSRGIVSLTLPTLSRTISSSTITKLKKTLVHNNTLPPTLCTSCSSKHQP